MYTTEEKLLAVQRPTLKVKRLRDDAKPPKRGNDYAAGYDLHLYLGPAAISGLDVPLEIVPGETTRIATGIAVEIPEGWCGVIRPRSSAFGRGLVIQGLIDSDYRGMVYVVVSNIGRTMVQVRHGERIAQMVLVRHGVLDVVEVEELSNTERGAGGFGSTGA